MDEAGVSIPPGGASLAELNAQNALLTQQAAGSPVGNMLLATARAADAGMLRPGSAAYGFLDKAMGGDMAQFDPASWRIMMARSGVAPVDALSLAQQTGENQQFLMRNPKYRPLIQTLRANQPRFDHARQFAAIDQAYGRNPEVARGQKSEYLQGLGYRSLDHYNQLHGAAAQQIGNVMSQAENSARAEQNMASMGWKGPIARTVDEIKRGPTAPELGAAFLGGVHTTPGPLKTGAERAPTVAVDLDGTIAKPYKKFDPKKIEPPRPGAKDAMQKFKDKGYTVIINTVRGDKKLVKDYLKEHEIPYDHVNENPNQPDNASDKLIADVYIDDRGVDARPAWRRIVETVTGRLDRKKSAGMKKESARARQSIRGIPNREDFGDLNKLREGLADYVIQRHRAARAGEHFDYRLGTPETGLFSWATKPPRLPEPGEKRFLRQQPLHSHAYGKFQGTIGRGYGRGQVRREQMGKVLITKATPNKIEYTIATSGTPERFVLLKPEQWRGHEWLLINVTPTEMPTQEKVHFKTIDPEEVEPYIDQMQTGTSVQAKLDGASALIKLMRYGAEVLSYRQSKRTGRPIFHTERVFGTRPKLDVPKKYEGTVLKGELYAQRDHEVLPPQELGGLLNATIGHSLEKQRERGIDIKTLLYDIDQFGKQQIDPAQVPYAERRKLIEEVLPYLPEDKFQLSEGTTDPAQAKALWRDIGAGRHPLTHEGVVMHPPVGRPVKAKHLEESDVHITDIYPGTGKYRGTAAGGFGYALEPGGSRIGEVGTGLSDELRRQLYQDPEAFIGRIARIRSQEQHPSGAWRAPALIALHEDYPTKGV